MALFLTLILGNFLLSYLGVTLGNFWNRFLVILSVNIVSTLPIALFFSYLCTYKKKQSESMAFESYFLEEELEKEKSKLEDLQRNSQKSENFKEQSQVIDVDDQDMIKNYEKYLYKLSLYGYKLKKYVRKYQKGNIELKLRKKLISDGIDEEVFKKYLKEYRRERKKS